MVRGSDETANAHHGGSDGKMAPCCGVCEGWLTKKADNVLPAIERGAKAPDTKATRIDAVLLRLASGPSPPDRPIAPLGPYWQGESVSAPVYARTGRLRL